VPTFRDSLSVPSSRFKNLKSSGVSCLLEIGPIGCPETSVQNYHSRLHNIPEDRRSHLHGGRSLKSCIDHFITKEVKVRSKYTAGLRNDNSRRNGNPLLRFRSTYKSGMLRRLERPGVGLLCLLSSICSGQDYGFYQPSGMAFAVTVGHLRYREYFAQFS
jgi:hypothetical protein